MKVAIHKSDQKKDFTESWIKYLKKNHIDYKLVDCRSSSIISDVDDCDFLFWHWYHDNPEEILFARELIFSLEKKGVTVFPNIDTCMHFDDKVAQKYLLEGIGAPLVSSYVFYTKDEARLWIAKTNFPKVFKLRGGAGSYNVKLVNTKKDAYRLLEQAFDKGFSKVPAYTADLSRKVKNIKSVKDIVSKLRRAPKLIKSKLYTNKMVAREKGYLYFQDFIPDNTFDIRVIVIGNKAFAIKRLVRENDFRASGSGSIDYNKDGIDLKCISISFDISKKLKTQSLAYDFVFDRNEPKIVEVSYGFDNDAYRKCPGYWDENLIWHESSIDGASLIIDAVLNLNNL